MKVKVKISSPGHLFAEEVLIDVSALGSNVSLQMIAEYIRFGLVVGDRWIAPGRILEFSIDSKPEEKVVLRG